MTHIHPGTDTTINPVIINDTHRQKQQPPHPQRCDGDCLSCDVDTYISCDKRINPQPEKKSPFDKIIKWKHDFIKQHGYYPNVNDIWLEVDKIRESDKRCASHTSASQQRIEQKFNSTDLLLLAHDEWKRREERKHIHEEPPWVSGFINGFCTDKKWAREYVNAILQQAGDPK